MPRLRSVVVVALIWMAAFAASSAPDGFGGAPRAGATSASDGISRESENGKRWPLAAVPAAGLWDLPNGANGKRWE
jgi:hypothetical protein